MSDANAVSFAVQSFCFREIKELPALADAVRACGLDRLELCGVHVDFQDTASHAPVVSALAKGGVSVAGAGVNLVTGDEAATRPLFSFLRVAGARNMSIAFPLEGHPEAFRMADRLSEEFDVKLGVHNHGGNCWFGGFEALDYIFRHTSPRVGLCLDTGCAILVGSTVPAFIDRFAGRIHAVHVKDLVLNPDGTFVNAEAGAGNLDLPQIAAKLAEAGFAGDVIVEYEGHPEDPIPHVAASARSIRAAFGA
ncbi:MAG: sugar phosphate isomerase/epimerase family protein [Kiritimatiellia bacterium]|jgi:inosose dehydratase